MTGPAPGPDAGPPRSSGTGRVLDVLETVAQQPGGLTLSEISRRAGLALTTTHRLVAELTRRQMLEREPDGRYQVGLRLWEIASRAPRTVGLREAALPFLQDLYEATHQNVQLAVMDGREVVYVERISGRDSVHTLTRPGGRLPLHATGVGLVLLAHAPPEVRDEVLAGRLARYTRYTITDVRRLRKILADVQRQGHAISERQIETISTSVAAPVRDRAETVVAALSIVIPAAGPDPWRFVPAVMAAARGVNRSLR